jgi:hypothetical protein
MLKILTLCSLVRGYPEDGGSTFLQNEGTCLPNHTAETIILPVKLLLGQSFSLILQ